MSRNLLCFFLAHGFLGSLACQAEPLSLKKALELASQKSIEVGIGGANAEVAEGNVMIARSEFWPKVNALGTYRLSRQGTYEGSNGVTGETTYNFSRTSSYDLAASLNIFNSFGSLNTLNAAIADRNAALLQKSKTLQASRFITIQAYFGAVAYSEESNYLKELVAFLADANKKAELAFRNQAIGKKEYTAISYLYKDLKIKHFESEATLKKNLRFLADLVGRKEIREQELIDDIRIERRSSLPKAAEVFSRYRAVDPEIKARNETIDSFEYKKKAILARDFPRIDLEARYGDKGGYVGLGFAVPIFSGFSSFGQRKILSEQKARSILEKTRYENSLRELVSKVLDEMNIASTKITYLTETIKDANTIWKSVNRSYRLSVTEANEWETALKRLITAEMDMIKNLFVYRVSESTLRELESTKDL